MAKKLPKGWSVKTVLEEIGLIDMYRFKIFHNDKQVVESFIKYDDRTEARDAGIKKLWEMQE